MTNPISTALRISSAMVVFSGYLALASVQHYGLIVLLIPLLFLWFAPLGETLDQRSSQYRKITRVFNIAFACAIPLFIYALGIMDGVLSIVIYIQLYILLHKKTVKEFQYLFLMAFFLLLAACVQSPEPLIAVALFCFLGSTLYAFTALCFHAEAFDTQASALVVGPTYTAGTSPPRPLRKRLFDPLLFFLLASFFVLAVILTVAIFFLTPRTQAGFLGRNDARLAITGLNESVDLRGGLELKENTAAVMQVTFPDTPDGRAPANTPLYWRTTTLTMYYDSQWTRKNLSNHYTPDIATLYPFDQRQLPHYRYPIAISRTQRDSFPTCRQQIYMDDVPEQGMPCLDLAQHVELSGPAQPLSLVWDPNLDFTVRLHKQPPRQMGYTVISEIETATPEQLRQYNSDYQDLLETRDYNILTRNGLLPETAALAQEITAPFSTIYDKAQALNNWFSSSAFEYSRTVPPLPTSHEIDAFINTVRTGHCELFASAMALMLRSLGIPTRVVIGYRGGEWSDFNQAYTVRASMAHMWLEVLFPDYGWVRFDPSPPDLDEEFGGIARLSNSLSIFLLRSKMFWFQEVIGYTQASQFERFRNLALGLFKGTHLSPTLDPESVSSHLPTIVRLLLPIILFGGLLCVLAGLLWIFFRWKRKRNKPALFSLSADQKRARALYLRLQRHLQRQGIPCPQGSAEELEKHLIAHPRIKAAPLQEILSAYNQARFGKVTFTAEAYATYKRMLQDIIRSK